MSMSMSMFSMTQSMTDHTILHKITIRSLVQCFIILFGIETILQLCMNKSKSYSTFLSIISLKTDY